MGAVVEVRDATLCEQAELLLTAPDDRHPEAVALLRQAVAAGEPAAQGLLTRAYVERGQLPEVVELLTPSVAAGHTEFAARLGDALAGIGHHERAEDAYRIAMAAGERSVANELAVLINARGRRAEAIQVLEHAGQAGDEIAPLTLVAILLEQPEGLPVAIASAEHWADESRPNTVLALAQARTAARRFDDAEVLHRRACELGAHRAYVHYGAFLEEVREDPSGAERQYRLAERSGEPGWAFALGRFLLDAGRRAEARRYLEHAALWGDADAAALVEVELDGIDPADD